MAETVPAPMNHSVAPEIGEWASSASHLTLMPSEIACLLLSQHVAEAYGCMSAVITAPEEAGFRPRDGFRNPSGVL